ncbi:antibiotic biosynthesis monooxygenase [Sporolactobacillus shoreae]|uniref:Antibiotic biosynthesis monooxygenase n=1 Tax=Sporolactobacillus shoreae TaxID=1465501 RepID=A0A4Z0GP04_9BACL|nr:antibiotic biosynthesis monooxygenase [Sporolactobacillus shoreae]TGA98913.1 antibiotic biosynthesis monooxygenase [Sporolactobacillus shoreae]
MPIAKTPEPPYYAVIFTSRRTEEDNKSYSETADLMDQLASVQKGFLGVESTRDNEGFGITVSYWDTLESIKLWKENTDHRMAQKNGRSNWYSAYSVRVCKVERAYFFDK